MKLNIQHLCLLDSGCRGDLRHEDGDGCPVPGERGGQGDTRGCRGQDRSRGPPGRGRGGAAVATKKQKCRIANIVLKDYMTLR